MSQLLELEPIVVRDRPSHRVSPEPRPRGSERRSQSISLDPVLVTPLRRPGRRARRKSLVSDHARPAVIRTAFAIVLLAACFAFAGRIAAFAAEPVLATYRTGEACRDLEAQIAGQVAVNEALEQDIRYLGTRAGLEQEARRRGWVLPGEVALSPILPPAEELPPTPDEPVLTASVTVSDRIRAAVDTCLAVFGGHPRHN
jgi:hypothetical protein